MSRYACVTFDRFYFPCRSLWLNTVIRIRPCVILIRITFPLEMDDLKKFSWWPTFDLAITHEAKANEPSRVFNKHFSDKKASADCNMMNFVHVLLFSLIKSSSDTLQRKCIHLSSYEGGNPLHKQDMASYALNCLLTETGDSDILSQCIHAMPLIIYLLKQEFPHITIVQSYSSFSWLYSIFFLIIWNFNIRQMFRHPVAF